MWWAATDGGWDAGHPVEVARRITGHRHGGSLELLLRGAAGRDGSRDGELGSEVAAHGMLPRRRPYPGDRNQATVPRIDPRVARLARVPVTAGSQLVAVHAIAVECIVVGCNLF